MARFRAASLVAGGLIAVLLAASAAQAVCEVRYHRWWPAWVRAGVMYGYPGARFWGGPWGGPHSWYPHGIAPWPNHYGWPMESNYPFPSGSMGMVSPSDSSGTTYREADDMPSVPNQQAIPSDSLLLDVKVPPTAVVYVNGQRTQLKGARRAFVTSKLQPGQQYSYELVAEVKVGDRRVQRSQLVTVTAGERKAVRFDFDDSRAVAAGQSSVEPLPVAQRSTSARAMLTLHVPAKARVYVDGQLTKAAGTTRVFGTTVPTHVPGAAHYEVRVEFEQNGRTQVREESVSLFAGTNRQLTIGLNGSPGAESLTAAR
ncbi:MAG TPA: TIGR03000 domain-containing protein [Pirellulales bacterium]|nr:TIGR03000 domain-containing protein [Pirellulales bacterium]